MVQFQKETKNQPVVPQVNPALEFLRDVHKAVRAIPAPPKDLPQGSITADQADVFTKSLVSAAQNHLGVKGLKAGSFGEAELATINKELVQHGYACILGVEPGVDRQTRGHLTLRFVELAPEKGEFNPERVKGVIPTPNSEPIPYRIIRGELLSFGKSPDTINLGTTLYQDKNSSLIVLDRSAIQKFAGDPKFQGAVPVQAKELEDGVLLNEVGNHLAFAMVKSPPGGNVDLTVTIGNQQLAISVAVDLLRETVSDHVSLSLRQNFPAEVERILRSDSPNYELSRIVMSEVLNQAIEEDPQVAPRLIKKSDNGATTVSVNAVCRELLTNPKFLAKFKESTTAAFRAVTETALAGK